MDNKKKIIIVLSSVLVLFIVCLFIVINITKKEEPKKEEEPKVDTKPKITEEYTKVEIETLKEYNKYLEFEDNMVYYYQSPYKYIVYKNGKILDDLEVISIDDNSKYAQYISFETYDFYITNNYDDYCVKNKQNNEIECYDEITTISNLQDSIDFLLLENYNDEGNQIYILNPNNGKLVDLTPINANYIYGSSYYGNEDGNIIVKDYNYLQACDSFNKCGLIDYDGNKVIDFVYDSVDCIDKDYIIVTKDDKQGIVNYKNAYKLPLEYNYINIFNDYIITVKDFKLTVYNKNLKVILNNIDVDTSESDTLYNFNVNYNNNYLYINVYEENINHLYLINNNKLAKKVDSKGELEYLYSDNFNLNYIIFKYEENNELYVVFYDTDLYEYYTFTKEIINNMDYNVSVFEDYINKKYYRILIDYDSTKYNKYYYIDIINSKEIDEITALGRHFSNGYTYTIINNKLNIYKEKELLTSFDGSFTHLNEYEFLQDKTNDMPAKIVKLNFIKETREIN